VFDFFKRKPRDPAPEAPPPAVVPDESREAPEVPVEPALADLAPGPVAAPVPEASPVPDAAAVPEATPEPVGGASPAKRSWSDRLKAGLSASRDKLAGALTGVFRRRVLDAEALDELETALLMADVGVDATAHLLDDLKVRYKKAGDNADPRALLRAALVDLIGPLEKPFAVGEQRPFVMMIAGVNGAGKTTSIGKLAKWLQQQGHSVLLSAGDTFRAAAREQLVVWGQRNGVAVIAQDSGDPAAVTFDAINAARSRGTAVVLADTAGRLPTQLHLMDELRKVKRVVAKADPSAPHEVLLVLDANTGQNALAQVKAFDAAIGLTGLVVTKLDGSAKGGVVAAIAKQHPVPIRFIGVGEGLDDLRPFVAADFVDALLPDA
jgi:fused signal recognition particle receptor